MARPLQHQHRVLLVNNMIRLDAIILLVALCLSGLATAQDYREPLTVVSWDGAYVRSQILGFIRPWEEQTGQRVDVVEYSGGIEELRRQVRSMNLQWDVIDLEMFDAIRACEEGLLEPIDHDTLPPADDGTPATEDFIGVSLTRCGVGSVVGATVVSYNRELIPEAPTRMADFFNLREFPGRRGLRATPQGNLEWALIADGVPRDRVYGVLSTERGLDRAFRMLDRIKPYVEWWRTGEDAIRLLETDSVVMSSVYSGRIRDAVARDEPLEILWDHQIWFYDVWGIPRHSRNSERAMDFIRFATSTQSLARQAGHIPYGPVRHSSMAYVPEEMRGALPTAEANMATAIELNAQWWSEHMERIAPRFQRWLQRPVMVPRRLPR